MRRSRLQPHSLLATALQIVQHFWSEQSRVAEEELKRRASLAILTCLISVSGLIGGSLHASAAPAQLLGKTIALTWNLNQTLKDPDGKTSTASTTEYRTLYISGNGRIFLRTARTTNGQSKSEDCEPGKPRCTNRNQAASGWHFEGNNLVVTASQISGATHVVVAFDQGFSSCTLDVVYAKANGQNRKFRGIDDRVYETLSLSAGGFACSIKQGNPFAD
jgi:hypothetical protein